MSKSICTDCSHKLNCDMTDLRGGDTAITKCYGFTKGRSTKADRIRAFTDEELARFIVRKSQCPDGYTSVFGPHCVEENGCEQCWLEWLRQETKEDK